MVDVLGWVAHGGRRRSVKAWPFVPLSARSSDWELEKRLKHATRAFCPCANDGRCPVFIPRFSCHLRLHPCIDHLHLLPLSNSSFLLFVSSRRLLRFRLYVVCSKLSDPHPLMVTSSFSISSQELQVRHPKDHSRCPVQSSAL